MIKHSLDKLNIEFAAQVARTDNPHSVTHTQAGAAAAVHTHAIADVTNLQDSLDDRVLQTEYDTKQNTQDTAIVLNTAKPTLNDIHPIGSVVLRMDAINPATIYGGTWSLITGDASLSFGDGTVRDGIASGTNVPAVPLLEHTHTFTGNLLPTHSHTVSTQAVNIGTGHDGGAHVYLTGGSTATTADSAGTPTGANSNAGTAGATLDVRGSRISINVWSRTA